MVAKEVRGASVWWNSFQQIAISNYSVNLPPQSYLTSLRGAVLQAEMLLLWRKWWEHCNSKFPARLNLCLSYSAVWNGKWKSSWFFVIPNCSVFIHPLLSNITSSQWQFELVSILFLTPILFFFYCFCTEHIYHDFYYLPVSLHVHIGVCNHVFTCSDVIN